MVTWLRKTVLAAALAASLAPAFAAAPPPVPALPDAERRTAYAITASTCACNVNFQIYGDSTDVDSWIQVWVNGIRYLSTDLNHGWALSVPSQTLATRARPISDAILTFNTPQTGTIQIVSAQRPRRLTTFSENQGVAARDLNLLGNGLTAQLRDAWDKINDVTGRALLTQPGNTMGPLPLPTQCGSGWLNFGINGLNPVCLAAGPGSGNVVGPPSSTIGNIAIWKDIIGHTIGDGGPAWTTPEAYGAKGDGTTDDAAAFVALCSDISAGKVHWVRMAAGVTYKVWSTAPATQSVLCNMGAATGVQWDFNGARLNIPYTGQASQFTGSISGTTLTVSAVTSGTLAVGQEIDAGANTNTVTLPTVITALGTGAGGTGTYTVSQSQTVGSQTLFSRAASITYGFLITGGNQITINGLIGTAATGKRVSGSATGINWVVCSNQGGASSFGCTKLTVRQASINGGLDGVAAVRAAGTGLFSHNIHVDGDFFNVGYPVSNQNDGLNTDFDIYTNNAGRSYIGYNVWGVRGRIHSVTGNELNDVALGVDAFQGDISNNVLANVDIEYVNRASTTYPSSFIAITHQQADPVHSDLPSIVSNVRVKFDVLLNSTPGTSLFQEQIYSGNANNQVLGDIGNTDNNIILEGKVAGSVSGTYLGCIHTASNGNCGGYNGTSKGTYHLRDLQITSTNPWAIGVGAAVTFENYASASANFPTFDGSYDFGGLTIRQPTMFANTGSEPINGTLNFLDQSGQNVAARVHKGNVINLHRTDDTFVGTLSGQSGQAALVGAPGFGVGIGANNATQWNVFTPSGNLVPNIDNTYAIGTGAARLSDLQSVTGTFGGLLSAQAGILQTNIAAPSTPASGKTQVYVDSTQKNLSMKNDGGTIAVTVQPTTCSASQWINAIASNGGVTCLQPSTSNISTSINALVAGNGSTLAAYGGATSCTNQFMTGLSAAGASTCTTDTLASAQHANQGTTTTVLHGNGSGNPSWGAVANADLTNSATTVAGQTCTLGSTCGLTSVKNTLGGDVNLNNTGLFFDGPSTAQGTTGTWLATGQVMVLDTAGVALFTCKLWDGTTVMGEGQGISNAASSTVTIALTGSITSPAGNIRISCNDGSSVNGKIKFSVSQGSSSTLTVVRIN